ncbi:hypothetical protein [Amycolatopsis sp. NPDC051372]|uniref:hypothetical protein n=1 Tax=Amycolatopsis sp. NPDC051372 TaxID=3155669 RepID=UPI00341CF2CB
MGIRWWRRLAPVLVIALGVGAGLAFAVAAGVRPDPLPVDRTPVPLAGHRPCADIELYFGTDPGMTRAAASFRDDVQARLVFVQTKRESWEKLKKIFKDHPEAQQGIDAADAPAVVEVVPVPGTDLTTYASQLKTRHPDAQNVKAVDVDAMVAAMGKSGQAPKCPRSGEY